MLPIIEHADIRRLLMEQKVAVEGSIALLTYCSQLVDQQLISDDPQVSQRLALYSASLCETCGSSEMSC